MTAAHTSSYAYSGYLAAPLLAMLFIAFLAWYGWRHRRVPGAAPFVAACLFGLAWALGSVLSGAALDPSDKVFWLRFGTVWQLPLVTAGTCFALQYAGLGRRLTRRTLLALAVPPALFAAAIMTDGLHHFAWSEITVVDGSVLPVYGPLIWADLAYSYLLFAFNVTVLLWLFARSPRHRAPVALMVLAQVGARVTFELGVVRSSLPDQWDPDLFVLLVTFGVYAIALFVFHALDPVPEARRAALETMRDGMLVVDPEGRVVDVNPGAERALGRRREDLLARPLADVLPVDGADGGSGTTGETSVLLDGESRGPRRYLIETTPLDDHRGRALGRLTLLHDVTEQQRAQALLLEQERVVATLEERERLARELHDSVGQVLGYLSMQAQTASKRLRDGDAGKAEELLARLTSVAQHAHADVRESILALRAASSADWAFLPTLRHYLEDFETHYGVATELRTDGVTDELFPPEAGVQLLRVIQEAMSNARRHGRPGTICITLERSGDEARITVADDGDGFDSAARDDREGHFGLDFMRERMAQIAGDMTIESQPGAGTRVHLTAPTGAGLGIAG